MKLFLLSFIVIFSMKVMATCRLKSPLFSLSGPVTVTLKELNLLQDKNLEGISVFNPIAKNDYQGPRLGGGLFLSRREDKVFGGKDVIYDQGRELDRYFKDRKFPSSSLETMGVTPPDVVKKVEGLLASKLIGCEKEWSEIHSKNQKILSEKYKTSKKIVFFLGEISAQKKYPEMVIGADGFVLYLRETKQIVTYPSELHYIRWSQKILSGLGDYLFVGVSEPKDQKEKKLIKLDEKHFNIIFPGALTPGQSQLDLIHFIVKNL